MSRIFIASTGEHAGLTLVIWAMIRRLLEKKCRVGFFKPFGTGSLQENGKGMDPDAILFKEILKIEEPVEMICPYAVTGDIKIQDNQAQVLNKIKDLLSTFSTGKDILLIAGSQDIFSDSASGTLKDMALIREINSDIILVHRFQKIPSSIYSILSIHSLLKEKLKGVVINRVSSDHLENVKDKIIPLLQQRGILNVTVLPEDPFLSTGSIKKIVDILGAKIICGQEYLDRPVNTLSVGASHISAGLSILKRIYNKIILIKSSYGTPEIAGIILTENREPPDRVLEIARQHKIPLLSVKNSIFDTWDLLEKTLSRLSSGDEYKAIHFMEMMDHNNFLNNLIRSLGIVF
ncbi:MAG: phosphotransacetylase family protein [Deltaproteobacteria bacterium]|nr:phosphotransacetylase family protein [Deltaproteobacteria bacterium]